MNLQERIEALEAEFNERLKTLKAEAQPEFPQLGDKYHYIEANGGVDWFQWDGSGFGLRAQDIGNIFRTKEQAEFAVEKLKVEAELRKFGSPFKTWKDNFHIVFNVLDKELDVWSKSYIKLQGDTYFESKEKAQQAIESVGEYRIKKYIFGVED